MVWTAPDQGAGVSAPSPTGAVPVLQRAGSIQPNAGATGTVHRCHRISRVLSDTADPVASAHTYTRGPSQTGSVLVYMC